MTIAICYLFDRFSLQDFFDRIHVFHTVKPFPPLTCCSNIHLLFVSSESNRKQLQNADSVHELSFNWLEMYKSVINTIWVKKPTIFNYQVNTSSSDTLEVLTLKRSTINFGMNDSCFRTQETYCLLLKHAGQPDHLLY